MGTPWVSQRGLLENDLREIANIIADLFNAIEPY
jgi:glycine/serine hydroxymethyltransferase